MPKFYLSWVNTPLRWRTGAVESQHPSSNMEANIFRREPKFLVLEHVTPATRLMEKRRQMFEVQETLEAKKSEFAHKEDIFKVGPPAPAPPLVASRPLGAALVVRLTLLSRMDPSFAQRREEELKRRDMDLQESLIKYSNYIQDNEKKRAQHDKKAREEGKAAAKLAEESAYLSEEIRKLEAKREDVMRVLETQVGRGVSGRLGQDSAGVGVIDRQR